jgi:hypothetical protein
MRSVERELQVPAQQLVEVLRGRGDDGGVADRFRRGRVLLAGKQRHDRAHLAGTDVTDDQLLAIGADLGELEAALEHNGKLLGSVSLVKEEPAPLQPAQSSFHRDRSERLRRELLEHRRAGEHLLDIGCHR